MSQVDEPQNPRRASELDSGDTLRRRQVDSGSEIQESVSERLVPSSERRSFLQMMGATLALSAVAAGCRWEREEVLPLRKRYDGYVAGKPRVYATSMELDGVATGLLVTSVDGRPIKIEGNSKHPDSLGGAGIYQQASILDLYDPDRSQGIVFRQGGRRSVTWETFATWANKEFATLRALRGKGLGFLVETTSSPTVERLRHELIEALPEACWVKWSVNNRDEINQGAYLAYGRHVRARVAYDRAAIVLCLDSDPMSPASSFGLSGGRGIARRREPDEQFESSRIYVVESSFSGIGAIADHRLPLRSSDIGAFVAELDAVLSARIGDEQKWGPAQPRPSRPWLETSTVRAFITALVDDLLNNIGQSVVTVGLHQPAVVHALAHRINTLLGNVDRTVNYLDTCESADEPPSAVRQLTELVRDMREARISTLFILGGNPVLTAPTDLAFADALANVKQSVHLSVHEDETSEAVNWHLPMAHYLESWGDCRASDGTVSVIQPLILPLFSGRTTSEVLAFLLEGKVSNGRTLLRKTHEVLTEPAFRRAVHDGIIEGTAFAPVMPKLRPFAAFPLLDQGTTPNTLELVLSAVTNVHDGRFANNGWLLELPDPVTKVTWDNALRVSPTTALTLGVVDGERVTLVTNWKSVDVNVAITHGQAENSLQLALGWGRSAAGGLGGSTRNQVKPLGSNGYLLRSCKEPFLLPTIRLQTTGQTAPLARTELKDATVSSCTDGSRERVRRIVREGTLLQYKTDPAFVKKFDPTLVAPSPQATTVSPGILRWAMSVDLNKCTGCNACVIACQAENNIPTVGKTNVIQGREMYWLRIDRYYMTNHDSAELAFQPVTCQQCENAPCEQVCPVGATLHSSEGLNDMTYNRCIGTRYCAINCPYKVRQFNYFDYDSALNERNSLLQKMVYNPDVTVRSRGVTEKCTFCIQRIRRVKRWVKNEKRTLADGDIVTACQQTCPTGAIVFGDLNDRNGQVAKQHEKLRAYELLGELENRPRVKYLARIRNRNPKLV